MENEEAQDGVETDRVQDVLNHNASKPKRKRYGASQGQTLVPVDRDIVDRFKVSGEGWQERLNMALRKAAGSGNAAP
jgi:uncharacterized protein (DUF4415 family)